MKYIKIIITIIVILFLIICIKIYNISSTYNYLFINANEMAEERHSRNEYFMYEKGII